MFSAGVDLLRIVNGGAAYVRTFLPSLDRMLETLFSCSKPVVAAVNGHAIAGGCVMGVGADYRMMAREPGRIGIPELLVGVRSRSSRLEIMPPSPRRGSTCRRWPTRLNAGLRKNRRCSTGSSTAVVDAERLLDEAVAVAESLAALPIRGVLLTKTQMRRADAAAHGVPAPRSTPPCRTRGRHPRRGRDPRVRPRTRKR